MKRADFETVNPGRTSKMNSIFRRHASFKRKAVIIGATPVGMRLAESMTKDMCSQFSLQAIFDDRIEERLELQGVQQVGRKLEDVPDFVRTNRSEAVFITLPIGSDLRILTLLRRLQDTTASVYLVPYSEILEPIQPRINFIDGIVALAVYETPLYGIEAACKRGMDILLALLLLLLLAPVFAMIALAVRLSSPGPVFFRQRRYGLDGREILVYKFRSMTVCEDGTDISQAQRVDPRVTRVGALLRRTSLDELPQLVNVLQGHMSIVGPRPHAVAHNEYYRELIPGYMLRHKVRPGLTGWAQVNGLRGETTLELMCTRIEYDLAYLRNWSLWLDICIILRTPLALLRNRNVY